MGFADDRTTIFTLVLTILAVIIAVVGLILGAVSLSGQSGGSPVNIYTSPSASSTSNDDDASRKWLFAIGHYDNVVEYLDTDSYQIKGYNVDVIDAVCDIADKNCELVWDIYENCWDSQAGQRPRGGPGLMGGWYDACTGWWQTNDRLLTYSFTSPFSKQRRVGVYVRQGNPSSVASNPVSVSGLKVGFLDGWFADELCLARYAAASSTVTVQGADQIAASNIVHLQTPDDLIAALNDGRVTVVFSMVLPQLETSLMRLTTDAFPNYCVVTAESMMTTKRNSDFVRWWDDAFNRLVGTKRYTDICNNIEREHGDIPGDNSATICVDP